MIKPITNNQEFEGCYLNVYPVDIDHDGDDYYELQLDIALVPTEGVRGIGIGRVEKSSYGAGDYRYWSVPCDLDCGTMESRLYEKIGAATIAALDSIERKSGHWHDRIQSALGDTERAIIKKHQAWRMEHFSTPGLYVRANEIAHIPNCGVTINTLHVWKTTGRVVQRGAYEYVYIRRVYDVWKRAFPDLDIVLPVVSTKLYPIWDDNLL